MTNYIKRLIEYPGALQVIDFAEGKAQLVAVRAYYGGPLVGQQLRQIREHMPSVDTRVAAIFRRNRPIMPQGDTVIEGRRRGVLHRRQGAHPRGDERDAPPREDSYKRVVIAGGGHIGERLAEAIESRYQVKIIEMNPARCRYLSENLTAPWCCGQRLGPRPAGGENINEADIFLALTNDDDGANIMSSCWPSAWGARKVMTIINNPAYASTWCRAARSTSPSARSWPPSAPC